MKNDFETRSSLTARKLRLTFLEGVTPQKRWLRESLIPNSHFEIRNSQFPIL